MAEEREVGVVKSILADKGFGFIQRSQGKDVFFRLEDAERAGITDLKEGDQVSFTTKERLKGPSAENLGLVGRATRPMAESNKLSSFPDKTTGFTFGPDYLRDGYFDSKGGKRYLRPEILDALAIVVAKQLGNKGMKSAQLRRFFNKARGIEMRLSREGDFEAIKADIYGFKRDVAYQVGRKLVPEDFQKFIDRNVELAVMDEEKLPARFLATLPECVGLFCIFL